MKRLGYLTTDDDFEMGEAQRCLSAHGKKQDKERRGLEIQQRDARVEDTWLSKEHGSQRSAELESSLVLRRENG